MEKNIGLIRVSAASQRDNSSLKNQKNKIKQYCDFHELQIDSFIEEIESGGKETRIGLELLRSLVLEGSVTRVIVYNLSRFSRDLFYGLKWLRFLNENGVELVSIQENLDTSSIAGRLTLQLLLGISQFEKDTINERMWNGKIKKHESGLRSGGGIPYGYCYNDAGQLVMDAVHKKTIRFIFRRWIQLADLTKTKRMQTLLFELKRRGYKYSHDRNFKPFNVKYILKNAHYAGLMITKNLGTIKHSYESVISERYFNRVQATFA
jgi:site-specific DNA recombinase